MSTAGSRRNAWQVRFWPAIRRPNPAAATGHAYAPACLLGLNGLRISEACRAEVDDLAGSRYQPTLRIVGKGDKHAEVVLNPRSQHAMDQAIDGRAGGPLLLNRPGNRMQRHNVAALLVGWHATPGSTST